MAGVCEPVPSLAAVALFGTAPARHLPQSGVDAVAYPGLEKDHAAIERATLRGPLVPLMTLSGELVEPGLVDSAVAFIRRNVGVRAGLGLKRAYSASPPPHTSPSDIGCGASWLVLCVGGFLVVGGAVVGAGDHTTGGGVIAFLTTCRT